MSLVHSGQEASMPTERADSVATLAQRLEAAEVGSRELDAEIGRLFGAQVVSRFGGYDWRADGVGVWRQLPAFTTSLDAALALAERVLPGWHCHIGDLPTSDDADHEPHHKFGALFYRPEPYVPDRKDFMEHGATRALAVCATILKAVQSASTSTCGIANGDEPKTLRAKDSSQ